MNLIDLSIRRPVFAWVLMFALIVFGSICANKLGVSQLPDVNFPIVNISINYEGAAPELIESEILDFLEERLLAIEGIKEMRSSARQGSGNVRLEFDINRNVDVVLQEVQTAISRLRFPLGVDPPTISKQNPEEDPILIASIYGNADMKSVTSWMNGFLLDQLRFLPGVGEINATGFSDRNLRIWLDKNKLEKAYLTVQDVVDAIGSEHIESSAGQFVEGRRELRVRWLGEGTDVESIKNLRILKRGGQRIFEGDLRIKDVADVEDGLSDIRRIGRVNGQPAVGIMVRKQRGTNEVDVANSVIKKLESLKDRFPEGLNYRVSLNFTKPTESAVSLTKEKLLVAGIITILVCFLFLGNIPSAVNILFSIPTSILGTGLVLYFSGFTLNIFTLLALTLAISIVVDDAIMLLENIIRHYRMGKGPAQAASDGAKEVLPAAVAATLAVVAVFLPVIFMDGIIGKFFYQFGVTMSAAVLLSLLEALTITPMRAAALLSTSPKESKFEKKLEHLFEKLAHNYQKLLMLTLKWKYSVVLGSIVFFIASMWLTNNVRKEFVPAQDQNIIIIQAQTPPSTSLEATNQAALPLEEFLRKESVVEGFFVSVGAGGPNSQVNQIFMPVTLKPLSERSENHQKIMDRWRIAFKDMKGLRISMRDISSRNLTSGRQNPIALNLLGPDLNVLDAKSKQLIKFLEDQKLSAEMDTDYRTGIPELLIVPNRNSMALRGVSVNSVGQILSTGIGGIRTGSRYTSDGKRIDIRFKIKEDQIKSAKDFEKLYVRNLAGNLIPLSEVVTITEKPAVQGISRINRQRAIGVFGSPAPGQSQSAVLGRIDEYLKKELPLGYTYALEGSSAGFTGSFKSLTSALLIGILVAYLILAVQFNSFIHPVSVLMSLPFSLTGALIALSLFDVSLNLFSFIGLIVLMGIAKKNSILLVEFTNQIRAANKTNVTESLLKACPVRLRPILMTSFATIAAALPLVVDSGIGAETRIPMGLVIIGGTIVSTLLTLFIVPAIYLVLAKLERN